MANAVLSWDKRPEYLAFTDWTPISGVTSYVGPRNGTGTNRTQFHPGQAFLSEHNLPDIMYQLHPCEEWKRFKNSPLPGPKTNPDGSLVYEQWTRPGHERKPLLDFKLLPDKISTEEGWWYHEFVRRMDPRIRQRDIIMREEASAERSRMNDQRYINLHLNTPGYRIYRPAWKMISWQVTEPSVEQNSRKQFVLDRLSDAQKIANTTRGSTPGLIDPALGEIAGNRVALPNLVQTKRGPRRPKVNANNNPAAQPVQPVQPALVPQVQQAIQAAQVAQTNQAPRAPRAPNGHQNHQLLQSSQAGSSNDATAAFPAASTNMGVPLPDPASMVAIPGQNNLGGYSEAQARDAAAMPPPPLPSATRNGQLPPAQVYSSHPDPQLSTNRLQKLGNTQADSMEVEDPGRSKHRLSEPGYPFMRDEELARMSVESEEAMAEIHRICEPFLDPCSSIQGPPPMDLSRELIEELGLGFLFPAQAGEDVRGKESENAMPIAAQTMQARNVAPKRTPMHSGKQGTKRKEHDDGDENFQHIQLDVEKQERRPRKQVKSVHHPNFQNKNGASYHDAANNFQQRQHFTPSIREAQVAYTHEKAFGGPGLPVAPPARPSWSATVGDADTYTGDDPHEERNGSMIGQDFNQIMQPPSPQQNLATPFGANFSDVEPSVGPAYIPTPAPADQLQDFQLLGYSSSAPAGKSSYGNMQAGQKLRHSFPMSSPMPSGQHLGPQLTATRPRSKSDRGNRESPRTVENNHRYHPYANSKKGKGQGMDAPQMQQLDDCVQFQPAWSSDAQEDESYIPDTTPAPLGYTSPSYGSPNFPLDPYLARVFGYQTSGR